MLLAGLAAILLVAEPDTAIATERMAELKAEVSRAEMQWSGAAPKRYSYTLKSGGAFGYTTYLVRVENGRCTAKSRYTWERPGPWKPDKCAGHTVAELFAEIRRLLEFPMDRVEWESDPTFGFPVKARLEPHTEETDTSSYFEISNFRARKR